MCPHEETFFVRYAEIRTESGFVRDDKIVVENIDINELEATKYTSNQVKKTNANTRQIMTPSGLRPRTSNSNINISDTTRLQKNSRFK